METKAQAQDLFDLAEKKGLYCSAYQNRRYDSDFLTVQKVIESGKLGELLEVEMHYDYYRPEVPEKAVFSPYSSYLYGHGCHTLDQVISYFGKPNGIRYDVRQLLGQGRMNDYFDIDLYYKTMKVSVKSSYFRVEPAKVCGLRQKGHVCERDGGPPGRALKTVLYARTAGVRAG